MPTSIRWFFCLWLSLPLASNGGTTYQARVSQVMDGDSLVLQSRGKQIKVRLAGIDAPEYDQPYGVTARHALATMVQEHTVRVEPVDQDRYGRVVARIYLADHDVNRALVSAGCAWVYREYTQDPTLYAAEQAARGAHRGLWALKNPIPPWTWRQHKSGSSR